MKNIVFLNTNHAWGGGEKWHLEMARALNKRGLKTHIICSPKSLLAQKSQEYNIPIILLKTSNLSFLNPFKLWTLYRNLKKLEAQVLFLNLPIDAKMAAILKKFLTLEKLIYRRGMPHPIQKTKMNEFVFERIDTIIANSDAIKTSISKHIVTLAEKTRVIYNGVAPLELCGRVLNQKRVRLGNLGRLVDQKGQEHLIEIAKRLKKNHLNFSMIIAGEGPLKSKLSHLITKNRLTKEVCLVGHIPAEEFFQSIDLFLFPSHFEGSANALIESQQHGVPALAFDTSSMPEIIKSGQHGFLIPPYNEDTFSEKIIELASSHEAYHELSKNCLLHVKKQFNYNQKVDQVENLIHE